MSGQSLCTNLVRDQLILENARKEAEFYIGKAAKSAEAAAMVERVRNDRRFGLANVG